MNRTILFLLALLLVATFPGSLSGAILSDTIRLKQMYDLAMQKSQTKERLQYIDALYREAKESRNKEYEASAMLLYARHYYGSISDSLYYWSQKAIPMMREQKRYEEMCRLKGWVIYRLSKEHRSKEALDAVNELKATAAEVNYPDGEDMANQALANHYFENDLRSEGVALYEEVLAGMEKRNVPLIRRIYVIRQLMNRSPEPERQLKYLHLLKGYVEMCEKKGIEKLDDENPVYYLRYMMHRNYAITYTKLKQLELARYNLQEAERLIKKHDIAFTKTDLLTIAAVYYNVSGEYNKTVEVYDSLLAALPTDNNSTRSDYMYYKAQSLFKARRYRESALQFKEYLILKDSLSSATYFDELAKMKTQHDVDKLELENKQMEMEKLRDHNKMLFLLAGVVVLVILCCLLGYLVIVVHRFGRQLKVAKEKAEEADHLKSAFLANMNHEIRTPLNAISGFSQLLAEEDSREVRASYANIVQSNNELLQRLIADVLDISKIESDTVVFQFANYSLPGLMKEIYDMILLRMPEGVELQLADCQPLEFYTDRSRLTQIMTNLLTNAIKHTEQGYVRMGYEVIESKVRFFVEDSGEGIPEDHLERIFSRFVQLKDWTKGVGLGLAICQGLITKMGGTINVESKVDEGSTFYVTFPLDSNI